MGTFLCRSVVPWGVLSRHGRRSTPGNDSRHGEKRLGLTRCLEVIAIAGLVLEITFGGVCFLYNHHLGRHFHG